MKNETIDQLNLMLHQVQELDVFFGGKVDMTKLYSDIHVLMQKELDIDYFNSKYIKHDESYAQEMHEDAFGDKF